MTEVISNYYTQRALTQTDNKKLKEATQEKNG